MPQKFRLSLSKKTLALLIGTVFVAGGVCGMLVTVILQQIPT